MSEHLPFHTEPHEFWTDERCFITELVNHEACPHISLALGRVKAGVTTQLHSLGVEEIYTVQSGVGTIEVNKQTRTLGPGDSLCIAPGQAQRITNTGNSDLRFYLLCQPRFTPKTYTNLEASS